MKKLSKTLKALKWTFTTASLLTLIAYGGSFCWSSYGFQIGQWFAIEINGFVAEFWCDPHGRFLYSPSDSPVWTFTHESWSSFAKDYRRQLALPDLSIEMEGAPSQIWAFVPLWLVFLVSGGPAMYLTWLDHRHRPGTCQVCAYNLTGNVSGRCPECGTEISSVVNRQNHAPRSSSSANDA